MNADLLHALANAERVAATRYGSTIGISLLSLLDRWFRFATEVSEGFEGGIDDYLHDLHRRDVIEAIAAPVDPQARVWILDLARQADDAFRQATEEDTDGMIRRLGSATDAWWWSRRPTNLGSLAWDESLFPRDDRH